MSCCDEKKLECLVKEKAKNLLKLLEPYIVSQEHRDLVVKFNPDDVPELTKTYLAPLYITNTLDIATTRLCNELSIEDAEIKNKIGRYFMMFCECIIGVK